jgi:hypothetical protein
MSPDRMLELLDSQAAAIERLTAELERLTRWQNEATAVLVAWDEAWHAAGKPGRLGQSKAEATTSHIDQLTAELDRWAWIARWIDNYFVADPGAIDIALEAWHDMRDKEQGTA